MKNSSLLPSAKHEQMYRQIKHEQMHRKISLIVLVPCLLLHILTTQWLLLCPSLVCDWSWLIFEIHLSPFTPYWEGRWRTEFCCSSLKGMRLHSNTFLTYCPQHCKLMQRNHHNTVWAFLQRPSSTHMAPEHNPKFTLSKDLCKIQAKCYTASSTGSTQDPSLSNSCGIFAPNSKQAATSYLGTTTQVTDPAWSSPSGISASNLVKP